MKDLKLETILKIAGALFVAGTLYANILWTAKDTQKDLESARQQIMDRIQQQEKRMDRIDNYLEAMRRNGL